METENKVTNIGQGLLWFGAAVSIAEIMAGAFVAPLGITKGILAIIVGHIIGCVILYMTGLIGAKSKLPAIESTRISFGKFGSYFFSIINILQLIGWTAVMIITAAEAMGAITTKYIGFNSLPLWSIVIGLFIAIWILVGIKKLTIINIFAIGSLLIGCIVLSLIVFKGNSVTAMSGGITFGGAVELSAIMPLSWLPLISDYTRYVKKSKMGTLYSSGGYFLGSCFMYIIGLGAAIYAGTSDITSILLKAGLGFTALIIVIFSTVTTTYLDVFSAGLSFINIFKKTNEKLIGIIVCVIGVLIAIFTPIEKYQDFLYLIGSVFAPLFAILLTDYYIFKIKNINESNLLDFKNIIIWAVGFEIYRYLLTLDTPIGATLPVMIIISLICIIVNGGIKLCLRKS